MDAFQQMRDSVRRWCREKVRPRARAIDQSGDFPWESLKEAAELGLFAVEVPEDFGGNGLGPRTLAAVCEELSWACPSTETSYRASQSLVAWPIVRFGSAEQKGRFLPAMAKGELLGCFGLTEPAAGSDVRGLQSRATRVEGGYELRGEKTFITNAGAAGVSLVFARTGGAGSRFLSAFLVTPRPGLEAGPRLKKMGRHGSWTSPIFLDGARVTDAERVGAEGDGLSIALATMVHGRAMLSAAAVGIARAAFEIARDHVNERQAYGKPLAALQAVQHKLADMATATQAARGLLDRALDLLEAGQDATLETAMAKVFASRMAVDAVREAMQVMGGAGYLQDNLVEMFYRDIKLFEIAEGANEVLLGLIAKRLGVA